MRYRRDGTIDDRLNLSWFTVVDLYSSSCGFLWSKTVTSSRPENTENLLEGLIRIAYVFNDVRNNHQVNCVGFM